MVEETKHIILHIFPLLEDTPSPPTNPPLPQESPRTLLQYHMKRRMSPRNSLLCSSRLKSAKDRVTNLEWKSSPDPFNLGALNLWIF
ncbi:autotransporter outer membrane beta-barrel domain-containing [Sesbania bispinosa]|nr:autotransporter outer membrane beta-barrel domain-containing [Sesbania bispinosa]